MKKQSFKVAFCGLIIALSIILMALTIMPNFTYALPAIAGALLVVVVIEVGIKYAFTCYVAVAILSILLAPDKLSALLYICLFGYYPITKALYEKIKSSVALWAFKFINFNLAGLALYFCAIQFLNIKDNELFLNINGPIWLGIILAANIVFIVYDLAIDNVVGFYLKRLHNNVSKIFK